MDIKCFFVVVLTFYLLGCHSYQHDAIAYQESLLQQQAPASNIHEPHFVLAKIYAKQNKNGAARRSLERASELARKPDDEKRYLAKLDSLN